jgi:hypothetical protein
MSVRFGDHLHLIAIENGAGMPCGDLFDGHAAFVEKRSQHMGVRDRVSSLGLRTDATFGGCA